MTKGILAWQERQSDSRFIQSVWTASASVEAMRVAIADPCISIALVKNDGERQVVIAGPKTRSLWLSLPAGYSCTTIRLKPGVFLKQFPAHRLIDKSVSFPATTEASFSFDGTRLRFPDFEQAERFISQLYELGYLGYQPLGSAMQASLSARTYARHMQRLTGFSPYRFYQLQRMHRALQLLKQGWSAADVAAELAFVDQSHFVRASRKFFGRTPRQLLGLPQNP